MKPQVFFIRVAEGEDDGAVERKIGRLYSSAGFDPFVAKGETVAVKTHFGEKGNTTHIRANHVRQIIKKIKAAGGKPYLTETSVLYKSKRSNALDHILLAIEHGFGYDKMGAPIIMADGFLGNWEREIEINGEYYTRVSVAGDALAPDKLFVVSHATGHLASGLGAALKNLGMGLSSRKGKLNQHSQAAPAVKPTACTLCRKCIRWCPAEAVVERDGKAFILTEKCIGCGECIAVCAFDAVGFEWDQTSEVLQKKMVEHACAICREKKDRIAYVTFLTSMTRDCDCMTSKTKLIDDIGIVASFDPVAIDTATLDLTARFAGENLSRLSYPQYDPLVQVRHAEKLGMGSMAYELVEVE
ncbi:MAG TPA: DUF362 domain-containing protein [Spirochaetota bacterium]|nr:DUF362 domain-containing protein [Spirochaetota bacterium]HNT09808.1 DUF362 domain-containing protein [Spirochaetota bacterium]